MPPQHNESDERLQKCIEQLERENEALRTEIADLRQREFKIVAPEKTARQHPTEVAVLNQALQAEILHCQQTETALHESERLFRCTFEQAAVGIAIADLDGRWRSVNQRLCEMLGYTEVELLALTFAEITHPNDLPADLAAVHRLVDGKIPFYQTEKRYICQDDSLLWVNLTVSVVRDTASKPVSFIAIMQDIGQRKEAKLLAQGQQMALQSSTAYLATQPELDSFLGQVLETIVEQFDAPIADIWLDDVEQTVTKLHLTRWNPKLFTNPPQALNQNPIPLSILKRGLAWESVGEQLQPFIYSDFSNHPDWKIYQAVSAVRDEVQTMVIIPLKFGDSFFGCLIISYLEGHTYSSEYINLFTVLTQQIVLAVQLTRLAENAKQMAIVEEHNRMAREIHDTLAQTLNSISLQLNNAEYYADRDPAISQDIIKQVKDLARFGLIEARRSVWSLHPNADEYRDLAGSLQRSLTQLTLHANLQVSFELVGTVQSVPPDIGMNLLRIGQEAIANSLRYARAQNLEVELSFATDVITLNIQDNGRGFNPQLVRDRGGFGLVSMQQRCDRLRGEFTIHSQPNRGTSILVRIPLISSSP